MPKGICYNASRQERRKCSLWHAKSPGVATSGAFLSAPDVYGFHKLNLKGIPVKGIAA